MLGMTFRARRVRLSESYLLACLSVKKTKQFVVWTTTSSGDGLGSLSGTCTLGTLRSQGISRTGSRAANSATRCRLFMGAFYLMGEDRQSHPA
jgi:hypothetical protein